MARWKIIENDIKDLILSIGGAEIGDEDIQPCLDFSMRNIKTHNFLDTDEKKVEEMINGIYDKLVVHNLQSKADLFKEYCQLFLNGPISKNNIDANTALHYKLLHLLLLVSCSPTEDKAPYSKTNIFATEKPKVHQKFDWKAYLCEGYEDYYETENYEESDYDDNDDSLAGLGSDDAYDAVEEVCSGSEAAPRPEASADESTFEETTKLHRQMVESGIWMKEHLMPSYWLGNTRNLPSSNSSTNRSSRLLRDWNDYLHSVSCFDLSKNQKLMTEYQVMREVLWMLNGFDGLFAFRWDGFKYVVNGDVVMSHLAESSLQRFLEEVSSFGTMVRSLKEFYEATSRGILHGSTASDSASEEGSLGRMFSSFVTIQCHQSFAGVVRRQLNDSILSRVIEMEKVVLKQDETMTLSKLMLALEPQFKLLSVLFYFLAEGVVRPQVALFTSSPSSSSSLTLKPSSLSQSKSLSNILAEIFTEGITGKTSNVLFKKGPEVHVSLPSALSSSFSSSSSPPASSAGSKLALHLLNTVYECFVAADRSSAFGEDELDLMLHTWMGTCRPYLEMLDDWTNCGSIRDPHDEFFIKRSEDWERLGEKFWQNAVYLDKEENTKFSFMDPVLKEVVVTGKSLRLLESITGRIRSGVCSRSDLIGSSALYRSYSRALFDNDELDGESDNDGGGCIPKNVRKAESINRFIQTLFPTLQEDPTFVETVRKNLEESDPLLRSAILNPMQSFHRLDQRDASEDKPLPRREQKRRRKKDFLLHLTLQRVFHEYVHSRYLATSDRLLGVVRNEYHFRLHMNAIKKYFLMESGSMMLDFYTSLFKDMNEGVQWYEEGHLKFLLCRSFEEASAEEMDRISIVVTDLKCSSGDIHCLESIVMSYKPPWPCDLIIDSSSMARYAEIFQFLLQIKWVKHSLDSLRFFEFSKSEKDINLVHRMFIFKMKILHFVNSFHNYIMTRILHSLGLEFQSQFDSACDFDDLISVHASYVDALHNRCLLHCKVRLIRRLVLKVFQVALGVCKMWNSFDVREAKLKEMEGEYSKCLQFLSSLVNKILTRGSVAHLELTAFIHSCIYSSK